MTSPRRRRSGPRALVLLLGLAACRGAGPTTTPTPGPTPVEVPPAPRVDPELAKIADAIDPGRIEPLLTAMPPWLSRALQGHVDADADPTAIQDEAREALAEYERRSGEGGGGSLPAFLALGRAAYLGERLLLAGRDDPELLVILERAYTILQNPFFTAPKGFFQVSFQMIVEAAARSGVVKEQSEVAELITFLQTAFQRARPLRQRSAALILRNHPEHPAVSDVLLHLADSASDDQDHVRAVELTRVAIARADPPIGRHWGALANRCAYALDVPCAKEAREKVRAWTPPDEPKAQKAQEERLRYNDEVIARAEEVLALADKDDLESTLRRAHLLILLARTNDAERLYEALRDRYPRDARPHAGLAKVLFQRNFDFYGAIPLVEAGRGLDHRDKDFFEVSLGLASARLMGEVIPRASAGEPVAAALEPFLRDVRDDARGWSKFEPGRGALLMAMIDDIAKILPTALGGDVSKSKPTLRRLLADLDRVRVANPEVADAWSATLAATIFADDPRRARAIAAAPLPAALEADDALQLARLRTLRSLVFLWETEGAAADLDAAFALLPTRLRAHDEAVETAALADALRGRGGDAAAARRAADAYRGLAGAPGAGAGASRHQRGGPPRRPPASSNRERGLQRRGPPRRREGARLHARRRRGPRSDARRDPDPRRGRREREQRVDPPPGPGLAGRDRPAGRGPRRRRPRRGLPGRPRPGARERDPRADADRTPRRGHHRRLQRQPQLHRPHRPGDPVHGPPDPVADPAAAAGRRRRRQGEGRGEGEVEGEVSGRGRPDRA
ncbi:MAG: hypothetical protein R3B09_27165 [Nannocystaceae bacterium]